MPLTEHSREKPAIAVRADYGIDAPGVVRTFFILGVVFILSGIGFIILSNRGMLLWTRYLVWPLLSMGCVFVPQSGVMLWGSLRGKLRLRDKVLSTISWRGDELVLDVGCGHGLMLIGAAKRLTTGKATGVDLWQKEDQAGNSREATGRNIEIEGVSERVELLDGDARKLPFADKAFDVVLSSWALHNIYDAAGRATAIREIVRVLKPGGRVVIVDIRHSAEYEQIFRQCGMKDVRRDGPNFLFVIPTYKVSAFKPVG